MRYDDVGRDNLTFSIWAKVVMRDTHVMVLNICEFRENLFQDGRK